MIILNNIHCSFLFNQISNKKNFFFRDNDELEHQNKKLKLTNEEKTNGFSSDEILCFEYSLEDKRYNTNLEIYTFFSFTSVSYFVLMN